MFIIFMVLYLFIINNIHYIYGVIVNSFKLYLFIISYSHYIYDVIFICYNLVRMKENMVLYIFVIINRNKD